jgi:hypothetical protein
MTQEQQQLLLKDLCGRLPYYTKLWSPIAGDNLAILTPVVISNLENADLSLPQVKPYLRPLSSMTEEEKYEYRHMLGATLNSEGESIMFVYVEDFSVVMDWLNEHHFDYRIDPSTGNTLIESELALEAPEDMYKTE